MSQLYVQLLAPIGSGKGKIGTAFPVAKGVLLSARHVLRNADTGELYASIQSVQAKWWDKQETPQLCTEILWESAQEDDIILLGCPFPEGFEESFGQIQFWKPQPGARFHSQGFAAVERLNSSKARDLLAFFGDTNEIPGGNARHFDLIVTGGEPAESENWKGGSGSPVIINDRVVGVIHTVPAGYKGDRLRASPLWLFEDDKEFTSQFKDADLEIENRQTRLKSQAIQLLNDCDEGCTLLLDEMKQLDPTVSDSTKCIEFLINRNQNDHEKSWLEICHDAQRRSSEKQPIQAIQQLVWTLLPLKFREYDKLVLEIRKSIQFGGNVIFSIPCEKPETMELYVATASGRPSSLKFDGDRWSTDEKLFVQPAESGPSIRTVDDFFVHAIKKLSLGTAKVNSYGKTKVLKKLERDRRDNWIHFFIFDPEKIASQVLDQLAAELNHQVLFMSQVEIDGEDSAQADLGHEELEYLDYLEKLSLKTTT